jgi:hypothetical protein
MMFSLLFQIFTLEVANAITTSNNDIRRQPKKQAMLYDTRSFVE